MVQIKLINIVIKILSILLTLPFQFLKLIPWIVPSGLFRQWLGHTQNQVLNYYPN